ncbi:MAG: D-glycero-beta-D-manno-heptose-7-phosphate kinase [Candidatus Omnitrophica bacterium]|nr:D-glycero-beta-D-manno-heptose-7-phosphate kinase [Candidatus Omnitrophota bacterium]MBU4149061.1 D-glycero-beta-D-manno-heptose-7-phosphate kinase [Candidatus Omnitrophota bacterium]
MKRNRLKRIIPGFTDKKVLIIGDLILDEFLWGEVSRISPEAPVPVVWVRSESFMPGGAANVANNIQSFGGKTYLAGVIGMDERGKTLKELLKKNGVDVGGVVVDSERPTILKTRIIAHHQQVVRIDKEKMEGLNADLISQIIMYVKTIIRDIDAIIIEDYGKGVVTPMLLREVLKLTKRHKKIIMVDPKEEHFNYYKGVTSITPNHHEASRATGIKVKDDKSLIRIGRALLKKLKSESVLVTLGEDGMQLFERSGKITHIPTVAQDVFDVSGAGDTVISTFTLALTAGASMVEAARISNFAAGIVVGKVGIATVTQKELLSRVK